MEAHPAFCEWLNKNQLQRNGKTALVVGCGMGDDAIKLEKLGFEVTAFDVSNAAIKLCKERFPNSKVKFVQADLLKSQPQWNEKFDFVLEIFTIQALPPKYEKELIKNISNFVSKNGQLLVIAEVSSKKRSFESGPPWVLNTQHIDIFELYGLKATDKFIQKNDSNFGDMGTFVTTFRRA
jgi:ubiquinone/menaquinone biosynthesis C-methylase UbiE